MTTLYAGQRHVADMSDLGVQKYSQLQAAFGGANVVAVTALLYQCEMEAFSDCPPKDVRETEITLYRMILIDDSVKTFLPPGIQDRSRLHGPLACCSDLALSLYKTEAQVRKKFKKQLTKRPNLVARFGAHIGAVSVKKTDGLLTQTGQHRDLYQYVTCSLAWSTCVSL